MDYIRFDSEVIEQLQNELKKLSEQTEKQKQAVQGIAFGLDQASGADVFVGVGNRKGSKNIAISNGTAKTVLGECAKSLQNCSEAEKHRHKMRFVERRYTNERPASEKTGGK